MTTTAPTYDVVIVGGGAAGLSAAMVLGRARRSVLVVDAGNPRNRFAAHVHGLLGRDGVSPQDLLAQGRHEARGYGVDFVDGEVTAITRESGEFVVHGPREVRGRRVIVATGLVDALPQIPGVAALWGTGAVVCPYCDGWEVRDQAIGVIATSPASRNQAHLLRQWSADLTLFGAREAGIAEGELDGLAARGIRMAPPAIEITGSLGDVTIRTPSAEYRVARVFVGARPTPSDGLLTSLGCETTATAVGSFVRTDAAGETSVKGVWAIGNVADAKALVPIAIGAGASAATHVNISLLEAEIEATH